jgi:hypothetical protein
MSFPFLPGGAILAATVLVGAFAAFALALRAMDRAVEGIRGSVLPGLVSGIRGWSPRTGVRPAPATGSPPALPVGPEIVELERRPPPA